MEIADDVIETSGHDRGHMRGLKAVDGVVRASIREKACHSAAVDRAVEVHALYSGVCDAPVEVAN